MRSMRFGKIRLALLVWSACASVGQASAAEVFRLISPDFTDGALLDKRYAGNDATNRNCTGANVSPAFAWSNAPEKTTSFVFLIFDPEGRNGLGVSHQVAYGIAPTTHGFAAGALSGPFGFVKGKGSRGFDSYYGPCPPPGSGTHHYVFSVIATDLAPDALPAGLTREQLFDKLQGHALAVAGITARFEQ